MIKGLNVKPKTVKLLEENMGEHLHHINLGNDFMNMTPKAQATEAKIDLVGRCPAKNSSTASEQSTEEKATDKVGENTCKTLYLIRG